MSIGGPGAISLSMNHMGNWAKASLGSLRAGSSAAKVTNTASGVAGVVDDVADDLMSNPVIGKSRTGSALKIDGQHGWSDIIDNYANQASHTKIPTKGPGGQIIRTSDLYQIQGNLNGKEGIFEWIVDSGAVSHRRFIPGGGITGFPNQVVK